MGPIGTVRRALVAAMTASLLALTGCSASGTSATAAAGAPSATEPASTVGTPSASAAATSTAPSATTTMPPSSSAPSKTTAATTSTPSRRTTAPPAPTTSACSSCIALHPNDLTIWLPTRVTGPTDADPACVNITVDFGNTMKTAATGYDYKVRLEWRDSAGRNGFGEVSVGPFNAPTVAPGAVISQRLHACAPSPAPAGKHASATSIPMWGNPLP